MGETPFAPAFVTVAKDRRLTIPQQHSNKLPWMHGKEPLNGWLLMLVPGRFRLLSDAEAAGHERLSEIRSLIINGPPEGTISTIEFESNQRAALIGRLAPVTVSPKDGGWRLVLPREILPEGRDRWTFVVLFSLAYLEIWTREVYQAALEEPLDSVI